MRPLATLAIATALIAAACSGGGDDDDETPAKDDAADELDPGIQDRVDEWAAAGEGGIAVALAGDDDDLDVLVAGVTGLDGEPVAADSPFRVGSISKTLVATMVLQLVDEGELALDDPVGRHLPDLGLPGDVTIRQLLSHRSGLPEYTDGEVVPAVTGDDTARAWTPEEVFGLVAGQPVDFAPDAEFRYSNTNYVVAGLLLEQASGESLAANLEQRIVEPLGLAHTWFAPDDERRPITGFAEWLPEGTTDGGPYTAMETTAGAAGALVSTAPDLATFLRALAHGELLDAATYAEMTAGFPEAGHGLGLFPDDPPTATAITNNGAIPGFLASIRYDPATEDLVVVLVNDDSRRPDELVRGLQEDVRKID